MTQTMIYLIAELGLTDIVPLWAAMRSQSLMEECMRRVNE